MNHKYWKLISAFVLCAATIFVGGHGTAAEPEEAVVEALNEATLIATLEGDGGWLDKQEACRGLRRVGTTQSIPALAELLTNKKLSHMARYAMEAMPYSEVDAALRDALSETTGPAKLGVIASLGVRRDAQAVSLLAPLLKSKNVNVAKATAGALGRICTSEAVKELTDFMEVAPKKVQPAVAEGLLAAAQQYLHDGRGGMAIPIYLGLQDTSYPMHVRLGAFRGLVLAHPKRAPERLLKALEGKGPVLRDTAGQLVAETSGTDATKTLAYALPSLPKGGKVALLRGLGGRGDTAARPAVAKAVDEPNKEVKLEAIKALSKIGGPENVDSLVALMAVDDADVSAAARASLSTVQERGVDEAIALAVPGVTPAVRAQLIELLGNRGAKQAVPVAVAALEDPDISVRKAGLQSLVLRGGTTETEAIIAALKDAGGSSERAAAEKALSAVCSRSGVSVLSKVIDAMKDADVESRTVLLRALGKIDSRRALKTVVKALKDPNEQFSDEAVRVLSNWPSDDAAPHLLKLAKSDELNHQVLGLRGYVRMAGMQRSNRKKKSMLDKAMELAQRPSEKKLVLAAWGAIATDRSLETLLPYLDDETVRNEAALAIIALADELSEDNKEQVVNALNAIKEKCKNPDVRRSAQRSLNGLK